MQTMTFLMMAAQVVVPKLVAPPVATTVALPAVPTDWAILAPMPYLAPPQRASAFAPFVAAEIAAGRCAIPRPANGHWSVRVDVAALVAADGSIRRTVPRAINCPTVEQYSAGLVISFARANLPRVTTEQWYHATIVYDWNG